MSETQKEQIVALRSRVARLEREIKELMATVLELSHVTAEFAVTASQSIDDLNMRQARNG